MTIALIVLVYLLGIAVVSQILEEDTREHAVAILFWPFVIVALFAVMVAMAVGLKRA